MPARLPKKKTGFIVVIAGPTGAGESSVTQEIIKRLPDTTRTVTTTSRPPRLGEKNKINYYFITKKQFEKDIANHKFLEYIKINNRQTYYGTSRQDIDSKLKKGLIVIANLEWRGAKIMKKYYSNTLTVFIKPEYISRIKKRLLARDPNISKEELKKRLQNAKNELKQAKLYDFVIINYEGKMINTVKRIMKLIKRHQQLLDT